MNRANRRLQSSSSRSSKWPVTPEVAGSSPVAPVLEVAADSKAGHKVAGGRVVGDEPNVFFEARPGDEGGTTRRLHGRLRRPGPHPRRQPGRALVDSDGKMRRTPHGAAAVADLRLNQIERGGSDAQ